MRKTFVKVLAAAGVCAGVQALGQTAGQTPLFPDQVLVVYDSRVADSRAVAEFYAGSKKVPGGVGGVLPARPGVRVFDLATSGAPVTTADYCSYNDFRTRVRDPIRAHLTANRLQRVVRCLVMTRGLPHRMDDSDALVVGDNPGAFVNEYNAFDVTSASIDSQLTLLWQDLNTGENGNASDSKDDGLIVNPYWKLNLPINSYTNANITTAKTFTSTSFGPVWAIGGAGATRLFPGDMYLVCRLDGHSLADVQGMVNRGKNILYNVNTDVVLLDEANSNGVTDTAANDELDNSGALGGIRSGDDYERTRDYLLNTDRRFAAANVRYNAAGGAANFFIGPRVGPNGGILVTSPVALLATYGSNHAGTFPTNSGGASVATSFADSFNYTNGAIFNTIESYNGRKFGGLTEGSIVQEQASDFIAAGGTLAIGHVWEPLADTIADNEYLASNFLLGNLHWAEAAWTSVPCLSWMHVAIGDPLARAWRSSEDVDASGRVGVGDAYAWQVTPSDVDRSGAADSADRVLLHATLRFYERGDLVNRRP
ncbi:MAG TPA: hypothetical protein VD997_03030 [Phycisphaerales bacterium]|nr:hypothetical protein [Phycisphaerales bacterium]